MIVTVPHSDGEKVGDSVDDRLPLPLGLKEPDVDRVTHPDADTVMEDVSHGDEENVRDPEEEMEGDVEVLAEGVRMIRVRV